MLKEKQNFNKCEYCASCCNNCSLPLIVLARFVGIRIKLNFHYFILLLHCKVPKFSD